MLWLIPLSLLVLVVVLPFLIPLPRLQTVPTDKLTDAESRFVTVRGLKVHYKQAGAGAPALVLLHGTMASLVSWGEVLKRPSGLGTLHAFDRPAFGLTERRRGWDLTPEAQVDLLIALLDAWGIEQAVLVGNSAGGTLALMTALRHPDRIAGLVLVDAAVYRGGGAPPFVKPLLATAWGRRVGLHMVRRIRERGAAGIPHGWDETLWDFTLASRQAVLAPRLGEIKQPALVITGEHDRVVPAAESRRLAAELPHARYVELKGCGHFPQEERPAEFVGALRDFLQTL
ncbi:MAG TPA: alpha/beta hydrolase [Symbiobacteriaceae bacterium]|nr:alpha/beta hydrolase [Symbiobacteriaceae bacterium]